MENRSIYGCFLLHFNFCKSTEYHRDRFSSVFETLIMKTLLMKNGSIYHWGFLCPFFSSHNQYRLDFFLQINSLDSNLTILIKKKVPNYHYHFVRYPTIVLLSSLAVPRYRYRFAGYIYIFSPGNYTVQATDKRLKL